MKYKVEILPFAWENLKKIEDYYILQFDVQTALEVSDHILDTIERFERVFDSDSAILDDWLNEQGYRIVNMKNTLPFIDLFMKKYMYFTPWIRRHRLHRVILPVNSMNKLVLEGNKHDVQSRRLLC